MLLFHLHHNYCGEDREQCKAGDMRPYISDQSRTHLHKYIRSRVNIFRLSLSVCHQIQAPPRARHVPAVFFFSWIGFICLMMAPLMTLRTWLMVKQARAGMRIARGPGGRGGCHRGGQTEIVGAQQMTPQRMSGAADTRHAGSLCLSQTNKDTGCREEINKLSMEWL